MLQAQRALMGYEEDLKSNPTDRKLFSQLYSQAQVFTQEYLSLLMKHFQERYAEKEETSLEPSEEEPPESKTA